MMFYYVLRNTPRHSLDSATRQAGIGFDSAQWLTRLVSMSFLLLWDAYLRYEASPFSLPSMMCISITIKY